MVIRAFVITARSFPEHGNYEHGDYGCELGEGNRIPRNQPLPSAPRHQGPPPRMKRQREDGGGTGGLSGSW